VCAPEELAACRERELRAAAATIGFDRLHLLGFRDRELADAPPDGVRFALVSILRSLRPQVVVTFDPNGFNAHPDHVAISRFTSDAVTAAADPRWYPEAGDAHQTGRLLWTPPFPPWEAVRLDGIGTHPAADFVLDVSAWRDRRAAALRAHRTQHLSVDKSFFSQPDVARILGTEVWRQAWGPRITRPARDVFDGL
jgi:N-acetyl-1-D-myo-inositol-2-amino-2-deoxy-alpha-D-glucopyranoside deacetylase